MVRRLLYIRRNKRLRTSEVQRSERERHTGHIRAGTCNIEFKEMVSAVLPFLPRVWKWPIKVPFSVFVRLDILASLYLPYTLYIFPIDPTQLSSEEQRLIYL